MVDVFLAMMGWMPSPFPQIILGALGIYAVYLLIKLVALVLSAIPFL